MTSRFEKEPHALFCFVDPVFEQARRRDIAVLAAQRMRLAHVAGERQVVLAQFAQHVAGRHELVQHRFCKFVAAGLRGCVGRSDEGA